jgi:hypothetical protein
MKGGRESGDLRAGGRPALTASAPPTAPSPALTLARTRALALRLAPGTVHVRRPAIAVDLGGLGLLA